MRQRRSSYSSGADRGGVGLCLPVPEAPTTRPRHVQGESSKGLRGQRRHADCFLRASAAGVGRERGMKARRASSGGESPLRCRRQRVRAEDASRPHRQDEIAGAEHLRGKQKNAGETSFACERLYAWCRGQNRECRRISTSASSAAKRAASSSSLSSSRSSSYA